jgi:hypothetical protein
MRSSSMRVSSPPQPRPAAKRLAVTPAIAVAARAIRKSELPAAYAGVDVPDISTARAWVPGAKGLDGSTANRTVTETYTQLDAGMSAYLGSPAAANWMSFGKYASREAGGQILRMEEMLKVVYRLDADAAFDAMQDLAKQPGLLGEQGMLLMKISKGNPVEFVKNTKRMHDALVFGNTGVYADVAPAYDTFLRAEAAGKDGVAALKAAGYGQAPKDGQGFLLQAFTCYQRSKAASTPQERLDLIGRANLLIGIHEQMVVIQGPQVFGDPQVSNLLKTLSGAMTMTDANGTHELLPDGGNWADFATRMGFSEVPQGAVAGAFRVVDHDGVSHDFVLHPDPKKRVGTIGSYFEEDLSGAPAAAMIAGKPPVLPDSYRDGIDAVNWFKKLAAMPKALFEKLVGKFHQPAQA